MSHIADLVHAHELEKDVQSAASWKKDSVEVKAASELCDATMKGLDSDKENSDNEVKPKQKHACNQLLEIVQQRNVMDLKQLEKARELDERPHRELQQLQQHSLDTQQNMLTGFEKLTAGVTVLVEAQAKQAAEDNRRRYEESEHRREDAERRAAESERHASLLLALTNNKNWCNFFPFTTIHPSLPKGNQNTKHLTLHHQ
ncbi:hypothetical protein DFH08DRAFT_812257 [Mycena albidolilacea]|uniref:Uncharacterized protein n=1 Tax=Mycena albidolilacea TaxID=1033008 RepID=A0AAD7EP63_9AGAR|nr:hypothetical protein DFH08DRAFT_812257 [Mycena albidolilacea]